MPPLLRPDGIWRNPPTVEVGGGRKNDSVVGMRALRITATPLG
jgi:hypothetical protein